MSNRYEVCTFQGEENAHMMWYTLRSLQCNKNKAMSQKAQELKQ